jgi:hypothetical protein
MDFIPEIPLSSGFNNILVIVDKLTKYTIFISTTLSATEVETAKLFFYHIISKFRISQQGITDREARWRGEFWKKFAREWESLDPLVWLIIPKPMVRLRS